jgi:Vacuolar protein sorting-associated protein 26
VCTECSVVSTRRCATSNFIFAIRYFLRVTIVRRISDIVREIDIAVHTLSSYPDMNSPIKMEVGIEDCLHIEFEYNKSKYHLKDVIVGKIYFLLVRIKIKHMEIAIIKRETTGASKKNIIAFVPNRALTQFFFPFRLECLHRERNNS